LRRWVLSAVTLPSLGRGRTEKDGQDTCGWADLRAEVCHRTDLARRGCRRPAVPGPLGRRHMLEGATMSPRATLKCAFMVSIFASRSSIWCARPAAFAAASE
jgi:hypothetical protein